MTRAQFWAILALYLAVALAEISQKPVAVPASIEGAEVSAHQEYYRQDSGIMNVPKIRLMQGLVGLHLVAFIGLVFFWNFSRFLFLATVLLQLLISVSLLPPWSIQGKISATLGESGCVLQGLIVGLAFFGPVKTLFREGDR